MIDIDTEYLLPYVPDIVINSIMNLGIREYKTIIDGSLLFADLSGFTAMSEKFAGMGRIGAETLTGIINDCFNPLLGIVFDWGGDVIRFGGDSFLVLFLGDNKTEKALYCANDLFKWISKNGNIRTPAGDFNLGIHAGISEGEIFNFIFGETRMSHLFCGKTVEKAYAAADLADLGQLASTSRAAESLKQTEFKTRNKDYYIVQLSGLTQIGKKPVSTARNHDHPSLRKLGAFIDNNLKEQLHYNSGKIDGEHRIITSLFIGVSSLSKNLENDFDNSVRIIQNYFSALTGIIEKNGGTLARVDNCGVSERILAFFGAPKALGNDAQNCLKAVLEIESNLSKINKHLAFSLSHRYGINTGLCFVGDVGGRIRREYTAMGDAINLAARLMSNAEYGTILTAAETEKICRDSFELRSHGQIRVKGKKQLISSYMLIGEKNRDRSAVEMIGRENELKRAAEYIDKIKRKKHPVLLISGEPGSGKTLLCGKIRVMAKDQGINDSEGACFKHSEKTAFGPIKSVFSSLMGLNSRSSQKEKHLALQKRLKNIDEFEWESLIAPLLDYFPPVPTQFKNLPEDIKSNKIKSILLELICGIANESCSMIIIEDIQWIDAASCEIVQMLMKSEKLPGMILVSRPGDISEQLRKCAGIENIDLGALSPDNSRRLFFSALKGQSPKELLVDSVIEKSGGNPFYLEEMAKAYFELGEERFDSTDSIPSGIESVITARIDNLGEMVKKTIRTASVVGRIFGYNVLKDIFPDRRRIDRLRDYLNELARLDLTPLERIRPALEYIFKHILTQEVAYNGLSFSARKSLHLKIAEYHAARNRLVKTKPEAIARHFLLADELEKALPYLILSGKKAASEFANKEAFDYFGKALDISEGLGDVKFSAEALICRGILAKETAEYKQAETDFTKLKEISADSNALRSVSERELSIIYRMQGEYEKASKSLQELEKLMAGDIPTAVFCLNGNAEIARRGGKLQLCRELLMTALDLINHNQIDQNLAASIYNNLGICHWSLGRLKDAAGFYRTALKVYRKLNDLGGQSKIINNLGIINDELGKLRQAAISYEKAEKIFKRIGASRSEAYACANQGTNLMSRGYLAKALAKLYQAKEIFEKIGDRHTSAYTSGDIGFIRFQQGDTEKAIEMLNTAIKKASDLNDEELAIESKIRLLKIDIYSGKGDVDEAENLAEMARKIGSSELEIKAAILKIYALLVLSDMASIQNAIDLLGGMEELENYPELQLDLAILKIITKHCLGEDQNALNLFKSSIRECFSRDLALVLSDLCTVGHVCDLMEKIPEKTRLRIEQYCTRLISGLNESEIDKSTAFHTRMMEFQQKIIDSVGKRHYNLIKQIEKKAL